MKICTITCHDVYNHGASLQAYALQEFCRNLGHDYCIIDYKPPYLSNHYKLWAVSNPRFDKPLLRELYLLMKLPGRLRVLKRKRRFDSFTARFLHLSNQRYSSCGAIEADCPEADLYIAGSDQIWNTLFPNGADAAFYLDFVKNGARKISYAASFATEKIHNGLDSFVKEKLKNFDDISVRESSALDILKNFGITGARLVSDPVFLLDQRLWQSIANGKRVNSEAYILVYDCEPSKKLRSIAVGLKKLTDLPIYTLSSTHGRYADKNFELTGPLDFISLISDAAYVVANSFHALAFSLIFRKNFFIVNRTEGINRRMNDLLQYIGLSSRLVDSVENLTTDNIDYSPVIPKVERLVDDSKDFIRTQIAKINV